VKPMDGGETQIARITTALRYLSFFPRYRPSVRAPSNEFSLLRTVGDLGFPMRVSNTPKIRVTINGEVVDEFYTGRFFGTTTVDYSFPDSLAAGSSNTVLIEGISYSGNRLWNLKRQLGLLEAPVVVGEDGFEIDFATATTTAPLSILNNNPPENGWNLVTPALQLGFNPTYVPNVNSDAILGLDLSGLASASVSFDLEYDTEFAFDFIEVFLTDSEDNTLVLLSESGAAPLQTYDFDVSDFAGKANVQLHFRFISDGSVEAPGVHSEPIFYSSSKFEHVAKF